MARSRRPAPGRSAGTAMLALLVAAVTAGAGSEAPAGAGPTKLHPALRTRLDDAAAPVAAWVFLRDKGVADAALPAALAALESTYDARAVERRRRRRTAPGLFDAADLPVAPAYEQAVIARATRHRVTSRWLNAVSVEVTAAQAHAIAALPFVRFLQPVARGRRPDVTIAGGGVGEDSGGYGFSGPQLEQIGVVALHEQGFTGEGIVIGVLDTGFRRTHRSFNHPDHPIDVIAEHDFVNDDGETGPEPGDPPTQHHHGTYILGAIGAYDPGFLVGPAWGASFILAKVEDVRSEYWAEEDLFAAGLEYIEANGGDVATSSLTIYDHYTQEELDGLTSVMTIAFNAATANGVHCCQGAGNFGHDDDPSTSRLVPPSDAFDVISVGAVDWSGEIAWFSSDGPTADGRVKPEVLTRGQDTWTVHPDDDEAPAQVSGTSLATPLAAGAVALVAQAQPTWTVASMRELSFVTADYYVATGTFDPLFVHGYGRLDAAAAVALDCNGNGVPDPDDIAEGTSEDGDGDGVPDECQCRADFDRSGAVDVADLLAVLAAWGPCDQCPEDLDGSGVVDAADLLAVLVAWGACG